MGLRNVLDYLRLGYSLDSLRDNLVFHNPFTTVLGWMPQLQQTLETQLDRPLGDPTNEPSTDPGLSAATRMAIDHPGVARWELRTERGQPTSVELYKDNGAYGRVEIDREFFRQKQRENAAELVEQARGEPAEYAPAPEYWALFLETLELFRQYDVKLVVNEIEEAPYVYLNGERRDRFRRFMREVVEPQVTARGGSYIRVDFEQLSDADYFDYNHLNTRGVAKFSGLLIERLRPTLL